MNQQSPLNAAQEFRIVSAPYSCLQEMRLGAECRRKVRSISWFVAASYHISSTNFLCASGPLLLAWAQAKHTPKTSVVDTYHPHRQAGMILIQVGSKVRQARSKVPWELWLVE